MWKSLGSNQKMDCRIKLNLNYFLKMKYGTPGGTRTPNQFVRTELLYPLSYGSKLLLCIVPITAITCNLLDKKISFIDKVYFFPYSKIRLCCKDFTSTFLRIKLYLLYALSFLRGLLSKFAGLLYQSSFHTLLWQPFCQSQLISEKEKYRKYSQSWFLILRFF